MKNTVFAAFLALALPPAARAEQPQLLESKLMEDADGVVVLEGEKPAKTAPAPAAKPAEKKPAPKAAAAPAAEKKVSTGTVKAAAKAPAAPAAAAPVKVEKVEALPAVFEVQAPAPKPAAVQGKPAAPAAQAKPAAPKPAAAPAAPEAVPAPAPKPAEEAPAAAAKGGEGFAVDKKHIVSDGETLWDLSGKYYNDPFKWGRIYNANLGTVEDPDRIYPAEELVIPGITEEVLPAAAEEQAPDGEGGVSDLRFTRAAAEKAPAGEGGDGAEYSKPAPVPAAAAVVVKPTVKKNVLRDDLDAFARNELSSEMPADQKEWSTFIKVVPENWQPDAVVTGRVKTGYDSVDEGLAVSGEKVRLKLSPGVSVKEGDILTLYLRGAAAFDKKGKRIGRELQPAGTAQVIAAEGATAVVSIVDASSSVRKGMVAKVTMRF